MNLAWINSPLWLIINTLAAYRLTHLWINDALPPLPRVRQAITRYAVRDAIASGPRYERFKEKVNLYGQPPLTYLVECAWCAGYWISLAVFLGACLIPLTIWAFLAVPFALSAVVGLIAART